MDTIELDDRTRQRLASVRSADSADAQARMDRARADAPKPKAPSAGKPAAPQKPAVKPGKPGLISQTGWSTVPLAAIGSSIDSLQRPTEDYYNRLGLDPGNAGRNGFKDMAVRAPGVISDLGAAVLDIGVAPVNFVRKFAGAEPIPTFREILQQNDRPAAPQPQPQQQGIGERQAPVQPQRNQGAPAATAPPVAAPQQVAPPAAGQPQQGGVFRDGNRFSDQQIGAAFDPQQSASGGFAQATPNPLEPSMTERLNRFTANGQANRAMQAARSRESNAASLNAARAGTEAAQRDETISDLRGIVDNRGRGAPARMRREAMSELARLTGAPSGIGQGVGGPTVADEATIGAAAQGVQSAGAAQDEELIAARFDNRQRQSQQEILANLANIGELPPDQQRVAIDAALAAQGSKSRGGIDSPYRLQNIPGGSMTDPDRAVRFNQQTGEYDFIDGGAVGSAGGARPSLDQFIAAAKADPRYRGVSDDMIAARYESLYGK